MLPLKANGLKWPEHRCLAPLCLPLNKLTCKFWKRSRGTLVPYCKWDGDRRGNHERWMSTSCPRGSGGDHGLSNSHEGVRKMVWHAEMWSPIPLSHLIKYDFFSSAVPGPFQVLGQHRLVYNGRVKSLRKRYSKSQTSCIFLQNPTNLPKPFFTFFLHTPHWDCYKTKFCHCQHQKKMQNCTHMARLGGAGGWSVNSQAGVASVGRGWGCPDNSPFAGQNQAHQQSLWCLWENMFMKGQKTVETERAEKGTKKKEWETPEGIPRPRRRRCSMAEQITLKGLQLMEDPCQSREEEWEGKQQKETAMSRT